MCQVLVNAWNRQKSKPPTFQKENTGNKAYSISDDEQWPGQKWSIKRKQYCSEVWRGYNFKLHGQGKAHSS